MSISVDSTGVTIVGELNKKQGGYSASLDGAPVGAIGLQLAWRGWFDSFSVAGPVSPYTRVADSATFINYRYANATWDHFFHFGLSFGTTHPFKDTTESSPYFNDNQTFFGIRSGETTTSQPQHALIVDAFTLGNIAKWVRFEGPATAPAPNARFETLQSTSTFTSDAGLGSVSVLSALTSNMGWFGAFPADPTDGAKFTCGWEMIIGQVTTYGVKMRLYIDTNSHAEADLLDVFTSYDYLSDPLQVNVSAATHVTGDRWADSSGNMLFPSRLMLGWGGPGQTFRLKKVLYRYLT